MKKILPLSFSAFLAIIPLSLNAQQAGVPASTQKQEKATYPEFSTAGFLNTPGSPRTAHDFNIGWKFHKGNAAGADQSDFDDSSWETVNTPHGLELVPEEASGCSNYQGPAWYRKTFTPPTSLQGKKSTLYFESAMGKSKVYLNGKLVKEHLGGFLPIIIDVTNDIVLGEPNVVAVLTDNSDDVSYPPGKTQKQLDFNYFGGIYRDVYFIETDPVHITDANTAGQEAGGGVFFRTLSANDKEAQVGAKVHITNESKDNKNLTVNVKLLDSDKKQIGGFEKSLSLKAGETQHLDGEWKIAQPDLWSPDFPHLHDLIVEVKEKGKTLDLHRQKVGIRHFIMNDKGLVLNEKPFPGKLIGGNRHQDFAYLGNAVSNIGQWRDAKKLRDAGMRVVRSAHYPQDPAFMDAADQLGLFVIVATPGWQFWNKETQFGELVYDNIRQMIRRDRNRPSVWAWEPILNETPYPHDFARNAYQITHKEYPYPSCYAGCDDREAGAAEFDLIYNHPTWKGKNPEGSYQYDNSKLFKGKPYFTREFGDNVDTWSAHNSPSRTARKWGESPMLVQANHYLDPDYPFTSIESLNQAADHHIGGALWHPFDHQRGYHPGPFYGGIMDAFRQPKTSYYAFQSQRPVNVSASEIAAGPMVFIAHEMTPFSPNDVTVYTNCDEVRLTAFNAPPVTKKVRENGKKSPGTEIVFEKSFHVMTQKNLARSNKWSECYMLAEGLIDGKVVATHKVQPAKRAQKINLTLDNEGLPLLANGTDFAVVVASVTDKEGNIKRLNNEVIEFSIEGPAEILGDAIIGANPRPVEWGTAPVLVRMGTKPGKVILTAKVRNEGAHKPVGTSLEFETIPATTSFLKGMVKENAPKSDQVSNTPVSQELRNLKQKLEVTEKELNQLKIKEVERQQTASE